MGSSTLDVEAESGAIVADPVRALQGLSQLATSRDPPLDAIRVILSSYRFDRSQENRKRSHETDLEFGRNKKAHGGDHNEGWPCEVCSRSYSSKYSLYRHVKSAHAPKRRLVVTDVFECQECEYTCATQAALDTHINTHVSSSTDKSPKYKCVFCKKELTCIYNHYQSQHKIEYPEQVLFDDGNVLVRSDINSENGKAPWFLKEKEKMELYDSVTCRLCEAKTSFDNPEILADHYTLYHMVEPAMLANLKRLFRAEKGAHLSGLYTSQTPKRMQCHPTMKEVSNRKENTETYNEKANLKTHLEKSRVRFVFDCEECDQVYVAVELLDKHKKDKHGPKTEKAKSMKYKCTFCHKDVVQIYKHYGNVHQIEYPEQMLFDKGNVLVLADINTDGGLAPWFLREKEKAENRYTLRTCRLCETEYDNTDMLEKHYLSEHKVEADVLKKLNNLRCLFRAEKGAHLVDLPASRTAKRQHQISSQTSRPVSKTESKQNNEEKKVAIEEDVAGLIMYQCAECGVAATTCDASIEHAQLHHLTGGYKPIPLTCDICNFAFEAQCYADHSTHHLSKNEYKIVKFHPSKLLHEWSEMFQGLSESHANRIKASSTYQYTRRVKMNSNVVAGIPLYQCGKCEQYVRPKDVEGHCYSKNSCVENQAPGHFCSDCERYFYSCAGLTEHEKEHRKYGNDCFRVVTFNCREDETIKRDLQKLQRVVEEIPVKVQEKNKEPIKIIENVTVSKFCCACKKYILFSEVEVHAAACVATHKVNEDSSEHKSNQRIDEEQQEQNCRNNNHKNSRTAQNAAVETGNNVDGIVELWNSDNDSCNSLQVSSYVVHADIHMQKEVEDAQSNQGVIVIANEINGEIGINGDVLNATNGSEVDVASQVQDNSTFDEFSEEMTKELKRDIQHLTFKEFGVDMNKWAYIPDALTNDLLETLENYGMRNTSSSGYSDCTNENAETNISQDIFLSYENVNQIANANPEVSPDIYNAITQTRVDNVENNINLANTTANQVTNINNVEINGAADKSVFQTDLELNTRPGSRVILKRMLSDDESALP